MSLARARPRPPRAPPGLLLALHQPRLLSRHAAGHGAPLSTSAWRRAAEPPPPSAGTRHGTDPDPDSDPDPQPRHAGRAHFGPGLVGTVGSLHSKTGLLLRCTIFDRNGTARIVSGTFDKAVLCAENGLEMRDLRKIDSRVPNVVPTILARRGAFLVNILHIRALVKHDTVLLFDGYAQSPFVVDFSGVLLTHEPADMAPPTASCTALSCITSSTIFD